MKHAEDQIVTNRCPNEELLNFANDAIVRNITERKHEQEKTMGYSRLLEGVLQGISDIIGVYKPDHTIMFYNQAGYDFYKKSPDEVCGRKCYEMLFRNKKCPDCPGEKAVRSKQIVRIEKYIPQFLKYMDCCYNPVLNESGEVIFVVERMTDITEKRNLQAILKESEERYRQIVDLSPEAIIITVDEKIVLANKEALKYSDKLIGENIYKFVADSERTMEKRINQILQNKIAKTVFDYKLVIDNNRLIDVEMSSSYFSYKGKPAILSMIRDITERKKELNAAARFQKQTFQKTFPVPGKAHMETLYMPARTVSGDFFYLHKVNEDFVIGIIGDVSGKGITAALSISAFNVLFHEAVLVSHHPFEIITILNEKIVNYLGERYIAACCFSLDFKNKQLRVVGAGINQFIFQRSNDKGEKIIVKGPFLGMFENSIFDEQLIDFQTGDRFYYYTDGLEFVFSDDGTEEYSLEIAAINEFKNNLCNTLNDMLTDVDGIKDDCTMIVLEIK